MSHIGLPHVGLFYADLFHVVLFHVGLFQVDVFNVGLSRVGLSHVGLSHGGLFITSKLWLQYKKLTYFGAYYLKCVTFRSTICGPRSPTGVT